MTFNLRFENDRDGQNAWVYRRKLIVEVINRYRPAAIGTQEGRWTQLLYLRDHLPEYHLHAPRRVIDNTCQYPTLFIRKQDFHVGEGRDFWLSKTPDVHRSKDWDSAFPRMMSYASVRLTGSEKAFWFAVTHLDHRGATARYEQARIIASWIEKQKEPVILMGDFNDVPGSPVHELLVAPETGLLDTWQVLGREEGPQSFTHHGFTGVPRDSRIDWILASPHFKIMAANIIRDHFDGRYPSDHFPYLVDLEPLSLAGICDDGR
ncbi:MAG: endonuclease/exonuclease/phosphatase family protein [Desulfatiglandaceae bacterium]|jgi:endonuclease/exonuclease/phosphatase family metal-dependent hydrolase